MSTKTYIKLTANISKADIDYIDELINNKQFVNRTDVTREAFRSLRRERGEQGAA